MMEESTVPDGLERELDEKSQSSNTTDEEMKKYARVATERTKSAPVEEVQPLTDSDVPQLLKEAVQKGNPTVSSNEAAVAAAAATTDFQTEIERMSKDTDAILDSIRNEVASSPTEASLGSLCGDPTGDSITTARADDDDWDDDMSVWTLDEEIRQALSAEQKEAEQDFIRSEKEAVQPTLFPKEALPNEAQQQHKTTSPEVEGLDRSTLLAMILVWFVIGMHVLRSIYSVFLDADGTLIMPFVPTIQ